MKENLLNILQNEVWPGNAAILACIKDMDEVDIADAFTDLDAQKGTQLFRLLPKNIASDVFAYIDTDEQKDIIQTLTDTEQATLINDLFADDAADLMEEMPPEIVVKLLKNANAETRQNINNLLKYPEDSVGSIMTVEYVRLKEDQVVGEVFDVIRKYGADKETIYTCYVADNDKTLIGVVSVKDLLLAKPDAKIKDIMTPNPKHAHTMEHRGEIAEVFRKYGFISLPVVDNEEKLIGIVTVDDILHVIEAETTEDMQIMAAVTPSDAPYLQTSVIKHSRNRIIWLLLLMVSAMLTGGIISTFEGKLTAVPMLIAFIPMLMDTGGNAGAQASTLVIRGIALGEITMRNTLKVWWKEVRIALICGTVLGLLNFVRILIFDGLLLGSGVTAEIARIATVVTLTLCFTIVIAKSIGCLLPIFAKKVKLDPAIMAAPLITTIVDAFSLLAYFGIAAVLLHI
ncbi:MAG: magnesium transporter [Christensenellaceae bacterium]|jgi:magnesium transporter|nr:magnesium transporter [Christensenellaceae bacterium]